VLDDIREGVDTGHDVLLAAGDPHRAFAERDAERTGRDRDLGDDPIRGWIVRGGLPVTEE